jgi:hypothetical protein
VLHEVAACRSAFKIARHQRTDRRAFTCTMATWRFSFQSAGVNSGALPQTARRQMPKKPIRPLLHFCALPASQASPLDYYRLVI